MATTTQIQHVNSVVNSMQAAAFGEKGSLLTTNNLLLAANQLLWQFIDPLLRGMGFALGPSPSLLTWLSPVGSLLTGQLVVGNRQHVRFISGVVTFDGTRPFSRERVAAEPIGRLVLQRLQASNGRARHRGPSRRGNCCLRRLGERTKRGRDSLVIDVGEGGAAPRGRVAWMVDTGVDGG